MFLPDRGEQTFWLFTKKALLESSLLTIWRIGVDKDRKVLTLQKFKENIVSNLRSQTAKDFVEARWNEADFNNGIAIFEKKVRRVRDNYLAHLNLKRHMYPDPQEIESNTLSLREVKNLFGVLCELFDVLCFDQQHLLWLPLYLGQDRENGNTDIDRLLDSVAKNSDVLNFPEQHKEAWQLRRKHVSQQYLDILNAYGRKFQMPPA